MAFVIEGGILSLRQWVDKLDIHQENAFCILCNYVFWCASVRLLMVIGLHNPSFHPINAIEGQESYGESTGVHQLLSEWLLTMNNISICI